MLLRLAPQHFAHIVLSQPANLLCVSVGTYGSTREKRPLLAASPAARNVQLSTCHPHLPQNPQYWMYKRYHTLS